MHSCRLLFLLENVQTCSFASLDCYNFPELVHWGWFRARSQPTTGKLGHPTPDQPVQCGPTYTGLTRSQMVNHKLACFCRQTGPQWTTLCTCLQSIRTLVGRLNATSLAIQPQLAIEATLLYSKWDNVFHWSPLDYSASLPSQFLQDSKSFLNVYQNFNTISRVFSIISWLMASMRQSWHQDHVGINDNFINIMLWVLKQVIGILMSSIFYLNILCQFSPCLIFFCSSYN